MAFEVTFKSTSSIFFFFNYLNVEEIFDTKMLVKNHSISLESQNQSFEIWRNSENILISNFG